MMDLATVRERYLRKRRMTKAQRRAYESMGIVAAKRFARALELSRERIPLADAAAMLGMTEGGLRALVGRNVGSKAWPIRVDKGRC